MKTPKIRKKSPIKNSGRTPSPRDPALYKTNLTNRHEKNSDVLHKDNDLKSQSKYFIKIFKKI